MHQVTDTESALLSRAEEAERVVEQLAERVDVLSRELRLACERVIELELRSARRGQLLRQAARAAELGEPLGEELLRLILAEG